MSLLPVQTETIPVERVSLYPGHSEILSELLIVSSRLIYPLKNK